MYPPRGAFISVAGDSTFIFGSVGNGSATLAINGHSVPVLPNGSFLAFIPVPRETQTYVLEALHGGSQTRVDHVVRIAPRPLSLANDAPLTAERSTLRPAVPGAWSAGERLTVSVRSNANAAVQLELGDARRIPLVSARETLRDSTLWQRSVRVEDLIGAARLVITRGSDSIVMPLPAQTLLDSLGTRVARLVATAAVPATT